MIGQVIFFNSKVGWGLISGEDEVYFVHYKDIEKQDKFKTLLKDQEVSFDVIGSTKTYKQAIKVVAK